MNSAPQYIHSTICVVCDSKIIEVAETCTGCWKSFHVKCIALTKADCFCCFCEREQMIQNLDASPIFPKKNIKTS